MSDELTREPSRNLVVLFWSLLVITSLILYRLVMPMEDYHPFVEESVPPPYTHFTVPEETLLKIDFPPEANRPPLYFVSGGSLPDSEMLLPGFKVSILHPNPITEQHFLFFRMLGLALAAVCAGAIVKLVLIGLKRIDFSLRASLMSISVSAVVMTVVAISQPTTPGEWLQPLDIFPMPVLILFHLLPALVIEISVCFLRWGFGRLVVLRANASRSKQIESQSHSGIK